MSSKYYPHQKKWYAKHMRTVSGTFHIEFVDDFKSACKSLGISQREVIRQAMEQTIKKAKL